MRMHRPVSAINGEATAAPALARPVAVDYCLDDDLQWFSPSSGQPVARDRVRPNWVLTLCLHLSIAQI